MQYIEISNEVANQSFTFKAGEKIVEIELRTVDNITLMSMKYNGNNVVNSIKVAPNVLLLGYKYLQEQYGDFIFTTTDDEYPYYKNFNNANKLYWLNYEEVQQYKNGQIRE